MPAATSPWRVNDVVAYDQMRAAAAAAFALLRAVAAHAEGAEAETARDELVELRREVLTVDAYDRAAVAAVAARVDGVIRGLEDGDG